MSLLELLLATLIYAKQPEIYAKPTILPTPTIERSEVIDSRVVRLRAYLQEKQSPLMESSDAFIRIADKYELDWTLLPAIAGVESGFERAGNTGDHNPFGYMCKSGPCSFDSFDEAIETVGRTIGTGRAYTRFQESGSVSVLAPVYNYVSPEDWTAKIIYFQEVIKKQ